MFAPLEIGKSEHDVLIQNHNGNSWMMEHKHKGAKRTLRKKWEKFVADIIVFVHCVNGRIRVDLRLGVSHNRDGARQEVTEAL